MLISPSVASPESPRGFKRPAETPTAADSPPSKIQCLALPDPSTAINNHSQQPVEEAPSFSIYFTRSRNGPKPTHRHRSASNVSASRSTSVEYMTPDGIDFAPSQKKTKSAQPVQRVVTSEIPQPVSGEYIVQKGSCQSYERKRKSFPMCTACIQRKSNSGACKFRSLRAFPAKNKIISSFTPMFIESAPLLREANLDHVVQYSTAGSENDVEFIKACISPTFLSVLAMELIHETVHNGTLVTRLREAGVRPVCDGCATTIFSGHFMCCVCGKEICIDCYGEWDDTIDFTWGRIDTCSKKRRHSKQQMVPFTYFRPGELRQLLVDVQGYRRNTSRAQLKPPKEVSKVMGEETLPFTNVDVDEMGEDDFKEIWGIGHPIVLTGCLKR